MSKPVVITRRRPSTPSVTQVTLMELDSKKIRSISASVELSSNITSDFTPGAMLSRSNHELFQANPFVLGMWHEANNRRKQTDGQHFSSTDKASGVPPSRLVLIEPTITGFFNFRGALT
jgi:hypothetical protein